MVTGEPPLPKVLMAVDHHARNRIYRGSAAPVRSASFVCLARVARAVRVNIDCFFGDVACCLSVSWQRRITPRVRTPQSLRKEPTLRRCKRLGCGAAPRWEPLLQFAYFNA